MKKSVSGSKTRHRHEDDVTNGNSTTVLQLIAILTAILVVLLLIWQIEQQEFDWETAQEFSYSMTIAAWWISDYLNIASVSEFISLVVAIVAMIEARISTGRIVRILKQRRPTEPTE
jgi:heme/copper-type cytochrome/quinol oxidase subunit 2